MVSGVLSGSMSLNFLSQSKESQLLENIRFYDTCFCITQYPQNLTDYNPLVLHVVNVNQYIS